MSDQYSDEQIAVMPCPDCGCQRNDHERMIDYDWHDMETEDKITSGSYITCWICGECFTEYEPNWELLESSDGYKLADKVYQDRIEKYHASMGLDKDSSKRYTEQVLDDTDMRNRAENTGL